MARAHVADGTAVFPRDRAANDLLVAGLIVSLLAGGAPRRVPVAVVSALVALLFAAMVQRDSVRFGRHARHRVRVEVLAVATSVALPRVNPFMRAGMVETGGAWVLAYSAFGVTLGLVPLVRRRAARQVMSPAQLAASFSAAHSVQ